MKQQHNKTWESVEPKNNTKEIIKKLIKSSKNHVKKNIKELLSDENSSISDKLDILSKLNPKKLYEMVISKRMKAKMSKDESTHPYNIIGEIVWWNVAWLYADNVMNLLKIMWQYRLSTYYKNKQEQWRKEEIDTFDHDFLHIYHVWSWKPSKNNWYKALLSNWKTSPYSSMTKNPHLNVQQENTARLWYWITMKIS